MKKTIFLLLTICLIVPPLAKAEDCAETLASDETFIVFCSESAAIAKQMKTLNKTELDAFRSGEEFKCMKASIVKHAVYLDETYQLFSNTSESRQLIEDVSQRVQEDCFGNYLVMWSACGVLFPNDPDGWANCIDWAFMIYLLCEGI